jgi:hypothetical protein
MTPQKTTYGVPGLFRLRFSRELRVEPYGKLQDADAIESIPVGELVYVIAETKHDPKGYPGWVCISPSGKVGVVGYFVNTQAMKGFTWAESFESVFAMVETT